MQKWFERHSKLRFIALYPFVAYVILFSHSDDQSMRAGIGIILVGLLLRLWANGYAIKMDKLTTSGPYAYVRNPLYLGTGLIFLGFVVLLKTYFLGGLLLLSMAVIYRRTISQEEKMLTKKFKAEYLHYKSRVPSLVPGIFGYAQGEKWPFCWGRFLRSKEYKVWLWTITLVIGFHLKEELLIEKEVLNGRLFFWMVTMAALILSDFIVSRYFVRKADSVVSA